MSMAQKEADEFPTAVLKKRRARPFFQRHPWVMASAIDSVKKNDAAYQPEPGESLRLVSAEGTFIAWGLWNPHSRIRIRLYSWNEGQPVDESLLRARIADAVRLRQKHFDMQNQLTACRLVFSEGDDLSGLTVDFYTGFLLVQFTSLALFTRQQMIVRILQEELHSVGIPCKGIWLRTEKGMREAEGLDAADGLVSGEAPPRPMFIEEHGVRFGVDVQQGQKTGCYLDQRDNRRVAADFLTGRILDAFCYSGGFGITAAVHNKSVSVLGIDSSEAALQLARANADLNDVGGRCRYVKADVRTELNQLAEQRQIFDSVVLDPPRMARQQSGINRALKGYRRLNLAALRVLNRDGILVTCSCSGLVSSSAFRDMIAAVSHESGRRIQILSQLKQPVDHPVSATCSNSEYLKVLICRVL